jgi:hypothetical protein
MGNSSLITPMETILDLVILAAQKASSGDSLCIGIQNPERGRVGGKTTNTMEGWSEFSLSGQMLHFRKRINSGNPGSKISIVNFNLSGCLHFASTVAHFLWTL